MDSSAVRKTSRTGKTAVRLLTSTKDMAQVTRVSKTF